MYCPNCKARTRIIDSRPTRLGVRRRHVCTKGHRHTTYEIESSFLFRLGKLALDNPGVLNSKEVAILSSVIDFNENKYGSLKLIKSN